MRWIECGRREGFTLLELMLVVAILGLLIAIVVPRFAGRAQEAQITRAKADIEGIGLALDMYEVDNGFYPTSGQGLQALLSKPGSAPAPTNWRGPYLKKAQIPKDPWGAEYLYTSPGVHNPHAYDLKSLGPNGVEGQDDITNYD